MRFAAKHNSGETEKADEPRTKKGRTLSMNSWLFDRDPFHLEAGRSGDMGGAGHRRA